ncbi:MAG: GDP-mannose 4,6-dehydratase [Brevinematia bacterium]
MILLTGIAGFIGFHLAKKLAQEGIDILGIDNLNNYYSPVLKIDRLKEMGFEINDRKIEESFIKSNKYKNLLFLKVSLEEKEKLFSLFEKYKFEIVVHLAAQAGVRYSLNNPDSYISSNLIGFFNILESCKLFNPKHLIFASSSSVYGLNQKVPFSEKDKTDFSCSLYGATKKSGEVIAYSYSYLYNIPLTCLRFFTVYGPWGRPDMAYFKFTESIINEKEIEVYNFGEMYRDFTYVDEVVETIFKLLNLPPSIELTYNEKKSFCKKVPYEIYNIGSNNPICLKDFIEILEKLLCKKAKKKYLPFQDGDVYYTYADINKIKKKIGFKPKTPIEDGLKRFVDWYKWYYGI